MDPFWRNAAWTVTREAYIVWSFGFVSSREYSRQSVDREKNRLWQIYIYMFYFCFIFLNGDFHLLVPVGMAGGIRRLFCKRKRLVL
jgi:hypothetical protein